MCDYSLTAFRNRPAVEGEELMVYRFPTGSLGLASPYEVEAREFRSWRDWFNLRQVPCAVCVPPSARLLLQDIPKHIQRQFGAGSTEEVVFTETSAKAYHCREAVRFKNGQEVLLQSLNCFQRVRILSLGCNEIREGEREQLEQEHRRREYRQIFAELV